MSDETYRLIYWPTIAGRAEPIRLILEEAGANSIDVAREAQRAKPVGDDGYQLVREHRDWKPAEFPTFAPPILELRALRIAQSSKLHA